MRIDPKRSEKTRNDTSAAPIPNLSRRKDRALVKVNCATLPANLIESELLLIRYIQYSIFPPFYYSMGYLTPDTAPLC